MEPVQGFEPKSPVHFRTWTWNAGNNCEQRLSTHCPHSTGHTQNKFVDLKEKH